MELADLVAMGVETHEGTMPLRPKQIAEIEVRRPRDKERNSVSLVRYVVGISCNYGAERRLFTFDRKYSSDFGFRLPKRTAFDTIDLKDIVSYRVLESLR